MTKMTNGLTATASFKDQYNDLIMQVFGFSFDTWFSHNLWGKDYESYSIIENNTMLANASVFRMKLLVDDRPLDCLQVGAVATRKEYRGQGLSRKIMNCILDTYSETPCFLFCQ